MKKKTFVPTAEELAAVNKRRRGCRRCREYDTLYLNLVNKGQHGIDLGKPCKNGSAIIRCAMKLRSGETAYKRNFTVVAIPGTNGQRYVVTLTKRA
jgi:hypothetical protein